MAFFPSSASWHPNTATPDSLSRVLSPLRAHDKPKRMPAPFWGLLIVASGMFAGLLKQDTAARTARKAGILLACLFALQGVVAGLVSCAFGMPFWVGEIPILVFFLFFLEYGHHTFWKALQGETRARLRAALSLFMKSDKDLPENTPITWRINVFSNGQAVVWLGKGNTPETPTQKACLRADSPLMRDLADVLTVFIHQAMRIHPAIVHLQPFHVLSFSPAENPHQNAHDRMEARIGYRNLPRALTPSHR